MTVPPLALSYTAKAESNWLNILLDENNDGTIDTLRVLAIRHAAALPYPHFDGE